MKIKLMLVALGLFQVGFAQDSEKIRLHVRVINSMDGMEIPNATIQVAYSLTENTIPLKTEKRSRFYEVVKGSDVKVRAEASLYYTEEKRFETEHLYDLDVLEVKLTPKPTEVVAEVASPAPFFVVVRDIVSGDRIDAQVEVTRPSGGKDRVNSGESYQPTEQGEYSFVFRKDGFGSYSQKQTTKPSTEAELLPVTFEVRSITFTEHEYALIDAHSRQPVLKSQLFILDENKNPVETLFNSSKGTYLTYRINPEKTYTAEIRAEGYEPLTTPLQNTAREMTLELTPADLQKVVLLVTDAYTRDTVSPREVNLLSAAGVSLPVREESGAFSALLSPRQRYRVQLQAEGYPPYDEETGIENENMEISLRKATYPLALVIENELTEAQKQEAKAAVNQANGVEVSATFEEGRNAFVLESDPDQILQVTISVPGFRPYTASSNRQQLAQLEMNVRLEPVVPEPVTEVVEAPVEAPVNTVNVQEPVPMEAKKGSRYALNGVNFEQSQTTMLPGSETKLQEVLQFMRDNPGVQIEVIGHTDKTGDERQNQRLSEFRARAVANWLFNQGIDSRRIQTSGKGSSEPVATNDTEEGKAQNRRIEVMVIEE